MKIKLKCSIIVQAFKTEGGVKNKFCNKSANAESKGNDPIWKILPVVLWLVCEAVQIVE